LAVILFASDEQKRGDSMRPKERRDSGQNDLFKARLDQIVDMNHALAKLAQAVNWGFLEKSFGAVYADVDTDHTAFEYFDAAGKSLGQFKTPIADNGLSFLGVAFPAPRWNRGSPEAVFQDGIYLPLDELGLDEQGRGVGDVLVAALLLGVLGLLELVGLEAQLELLGEVLDRRDFLQDLLETLIQEPVERLSLDAHEVGKREDLVELGETDTIADRDELLRQTRSLPGLLAGAMRSAVDVTANG
jgi:hypothetical protein